MKGVFELSGVFICYRRSDTAGFAGRLYDDLAERFTAEAIFRDIPTLSIGVDFVKAIEDCIRQCHAVAVIIGKEWLATTDNDGNRRIDRTDDQVRLEIEAALQHSIPIVPILVGASRMPTAVELPTSISALATINAIELTDARWDFDVKRLIEALEKALEAYGLPTLVIVTWNRIVREPWAMSLGGSLPDATELEASRPSAMVVNSWLRSHGAADHLETILRVLLQGATSKTIVVRDIGVEIARHPSFSGTRVFCPSAGANAATLLVFDLDESEPRAWEWREDGGRQLIGQRPYFETHNFTLEGNEAHEFLIVGQAQRSRCSWRLSFELVAGQHQQRVIVDDDGRPFETSGDPVDGFASYLHWAWYEGGHFLPVSAG
jgi:hypothetical protein